MAFFRDSGVLLHPTSLPGKYGSGDLGQSAYKFIDWLNLAGQNYWQVLPLVSVGINNSPYTSTSAFAGNIFLIDLDYLLQKNYLTANDLNPPSEICNNNRQINFEVVHNWRLEKLKCACNNFFKNKINDSEYKKFTSFCAQESFWLDDYALFMALYEHFRQDWIYWDMAYAKREPAALLSATQNSTNEIQFHKFLQWVFFEQWQALRIYAKSKNINIIGDLPIYVSLNSADVWANQELFKLDKNLQPFVVAGVPPDYYAVEGQRWGNPIYDWKKNQETKYQWWINRLQKLFTMFDIIRIDHFLGFTRYWEIPANEPTAINGAWVDGPKDDFFASIKAELFPKQKIMPIIAEDLGINNPESTILRDKFNFPGMRVIQFAWGSGNDNLHLPHNHSDNSIVFSGTHDNDTIIGWYKQSKDWERAHLHDYLQYFDVEKEKINWRLIRACMESKSVLAIFPLQDILGLDSEHRMNTPGVAKGNWGWRFAWEQITPEITEQFRTLTISNNR